jgi:hypothetical protein
VLDSHSTDEIPKWKQFIADIEPDCVLLLAINNMETDYDGNHRKGRGMRKVAP